MNHIEEYELNLIDESFKSESIRLMNLKFKSISDETVNKWFIADRMEDFFEELGFLG